MALNDPMRCCLLILICAVAIFAGRAQAAADRPRDLRDGPALYKAACAACHGEDGAGAPRPDLGFEPPATFPDFTDCSQASPEQDVAWRAMVRDGGRARGFSEIMPAFGGALDAAQIAALVRHLRSFCRDSRWPRGELNVPRALLTEKAFPEDETVLSVGLDLGGSRAAEGELGYEHRLGPRGQLEVALPFAAVPAPAGGTTRGIGDVVVGLKRVLNARYDDATEQGSIFAVQGEVALPTGDSGRGLGAGTPVFGLFGAYDRLLFRRAFLQVQAGIDLPARSGDIPKVAFLRSALGTSIASGGGSGRTWSPMIEVAAERPLDGSEPTQWDLAPGVQITLSARQHVRAALGYLRPLTQRHDREDQLLFYLLWDWADGGLREGW